MAETVTIGGVQVRTQGWQVTRDSQGFRYRSHLAVYLTRDDGTGQQAELPDAEVRYLEYCGVVLQAAFEWPVVEPSATGLQPDLATLQAAHDQWVADTMAAATAAYVGQSYEIGPLGG